MCERCGYSGCRHDWQRWAPKAYREGYRDGDNGNEPQVPEVYGMLNRGGYFAGWHAGNYFRRQRERAKVDDG